MGRRRVGSWVEGKGREHLREEQKGHRSPLHHQGGSHGRGGLVGKTHWKGVTQGLPEMAGPVCLPEQKECVFLPQ